MCKQLLVIEDQQTGRYLSWRSAPITEDNQQMFITYTGKIGTDFFSFQQEAEKVLKEIQKRINRVLHIVSINPDELLLGERYIEILN